MFPHPFSFITTYIAPSSGNIAWVGAAGTDMDAGFANPSPVINYPTVQANDVMLAIFGTSTTNPWSNSPPSGWTMISSIADTDLDSGCAVLWRRATGSEGATEEWTNFFLGAIETGRVIVAAYRGCVASGSPINTYQATSTTGGTSKTVGSVTTTAANCMLVGTMSCDPTATSEFTFASGTTRINRSSTPIGNYGSNSLVSVVEQVAASAGAVSITGSYNESEAACHHLIALTPA